MPSVPYARSRDALFHPGAATDFFTLGDTSTDAALCVEMARVAYVKLEAALREYLRRAGFELRVFLDRSGSEGFVAESQSTLVVAFRGTEPDDPTDLLTDANVPLTPWSAGGAVHIGFADGLSPLWRAVEPTLTTTKRVLFTGHSLGAALATLAATLRRPTALHTFGSPLVGNAEFARVADTVEHVRYVDCCDGVTRVPPEPLGYQHCGRLAFIDRHGVVRSGMSPKDIEAERIEASSEYLLKWGFVRGTVALRELADHAPVNYSSAVLGVRQG
jgi:hypothetical protein